MNARFSGIRCAVLLLLLPCSVFGYTEFTSDRLQLWTGAGYQGGDVSYRIGGHIVDSVKGVSNVHFPISELKWPVNVPVATVGLKLRMLDRCELFGQYSGANCAYAGRMEDSDWLYSGIPEQYLNSYRSIFSLSSARTSGFTGEGSIRCWLKDHDAFFDGERYGFGFGLLRQEYRWTASDLDQWYPMNPELGHDIVAGRAGTYRASMTVPYFEVVCEMRKPGTMIDGSLGLSPTATVSDEDNHLLRSILARTEATGYAFLASAGVKYDLARHLFATVRADGMYLTTTGTQYSTTYAGADAGHSWTIDHKVTSLQYNFFLNLGYRY